MPNNLTLTIDGRKVTVPQGSTILDAAIKLDIDIPTLCHSKDLKPFTSCFICVVDVEGRKNPVPSCSTEALEGMVITTNSERIRDTRKMCLELLLSDHVGDCVAPCTLTCPAGCNIQEFVEQIGDNRDEDAIVTIKDALPIPGALGRICPRPCEEQCRRVVVEAPVAIAWLHRYAADVDAETGTIYTPPTGEDTGKRVAIVGGGPAGISAAYFLRRLGHGVTLFEAEEELGGMLRWGIPAYRLPREELAREFNAIIDMGVELHTGKTFGKDFSLTDLKTQGFDSVFLAVGAQLSSSMWCPGEDLPGVYGGIDFLARVAHGEKVDPGKKVIVVGGGNTAIDAVRTAKRLGADVTLLYRRTRSEMPALEIEIREAEREGVKFKFLAAPLEIKESNGRLSVTCQQMELGEPGPDGRRRPVPVEGEIFELPADSVIVAIGQKIDADLLNSQGVALDKRSSVIEVDNYTLQTSIPGVFAGGDAVAGDANKIAVWAVGSGRLASVCIDQYLKGELVRGKSAEFTISMGGSPNDVTPLRFEGIDTEARVDMPELDLQDRVTNFREVEIGLTPDLANQEAKRCISCGCSMGSCCTIRQYALEYCVDLNRFPGATREYGVDHSLGNIVVESGKCISCGLCVRTCLETSDWELFGFIGRGFDVRIKPYANLPFDKSACDADACGEKCAEVCPTGALVSLRKLRERPFAGCAGCGFPFQK